MTKMKKGSRDLLMAKVALAVGAELQHRRLEDMDKECCRHARLDMGIACAVCFERILRQRMPDARGWMCLNAHSLKVNVHKTFRTKIDIEKLLSALVADKQAALEFWYLRDFINPERGQEACTWILQNCCSS